MQDAPDREKIVSPEITEEEKKRLFEVWLRNSSEAFLRLRAHETFKVSLWDGVDNVASHARNLFDSISPALAIRPDASELEIFKQALRIFCMIAALASRSGRPELEAIAYSLQRGIFALGERERGFDEPFLRVRRRLPSERRESIGERYIKAIAAEACNELLRYGFKDAARQVAEVINKNKILPPKRNNLAVVDRTVANWYARWQAGDLKPAFWPTPGGILFPKASKLWDEGKPEAARRMLLRNLPRLMKEIRSGVDPGREVLFSETIKA